MKVKIKQVFSRQLRNPRSLCLRPVHYLVPGGMVPA